MVILQRFLFKTFLVLSSLIFVSGCSDIGKLKTLKAYQNQSAEETAADPENGNDLLAELARNLGDIDAPTGAGAWYREGDREEADSLRVYVSDAIQAALEKKDYKLLLAIFEQMYLSSSGRYVGYYIPSSMNERMHQAYKDISNAGGQWSTRGMSTLINIVGNQMLSERKYLSAYNFFAKVTLSWEENSEDNADTVRGILIHFGCAQDASIWGEFTAIPPMAKIKGESYPLIEVEKNFDIALARRSLSMNKVVPELQGKCPVNLYP